MFSGVTILGVFYILVIISCMILYFLFKDDVWLQGLFAIFGFITLAIFVVHSYWGYHVLVDSPAGFIRLTAENAKIDFDSSSYTQEGFMDGDTYHYYYFESDILDKSYYRNARICFRYNNSDASNIVRFIDGNFTVITENIYLGTGFDTFCGVIPSISSIRDFDLIGFNCLDCSASNVFYLLKDNNSVDVTEVEVNITTHPVGVDYDVDSEKAHFVWFEVRVLPIKDVKDNFFLFIWLLGFFILALALRGIIVIYGGFVDEFSKK